MAEIAAMAGNAMFSMVKGSQERKQRYAEAAAIRDAAMRKGAATTAAVGQEQRNKDYMESRAIALAAFQGGGVSDPSITRLVGDINAEGEYRVLSTLYTGMGEAQGLQYASEQAMKSGDIALKRGYVGAIKTVLSSYGSGMWKGHKELPDWTPKDEGTMDYNPSSGAAVYA